MPRAQRLRFSRTFWKDRVRVVDSSSSDSAALRDALASAGLRWTVQREAVYRALRALEPGHPTAEQVFREVRRHLPKISLATVYKAIDALEASGKATRLAGADGSARFDARDDCHYHLRCVRTGRVEDLATPYDPELLRALDPSLTEQLRRDGFELLGYRLELVGFFVGKEPS
jgi:Fe2+ or Zn2+ uptake regulation protein